MKTPFLKSCMISPSVGELKKIIQKGEDFYEEFYEEVIFLYFRQPSDSNQDGMGNREVGLGCCSVPVVDCKWNFNIRYRICYIKIDIGWILFALILILLSRFILIRTMFVPGDRVYTEICIFAIDKLPFALMLAGIIVQCMKKTAGLKIPEEVVRMHLFWAGLIWLAANIILYVTNDGEVDDEQLDEDRDRENHDSAG